MKIIAVDFDGTLCRAAEFPAIGAPRRAVIAALKREAREGAKIILWTCRAGEHLSEAVAWCWRQGLRFDAVNQSLPEMIALFGGDTRKVFASEYWDDRAVRIGKPSIINSLFLLFDLWLVRRF